MKRTIFLITFVTSVILSTGLHAQIRNIVQFDCVLKNGSGLRKVNTILTDRGYDIDFAGNPKTGAEYHVVETKKRILDRQAGPFILGGHSYGGTIITIPGIFRTLTNSFTFLPLRPLKKNHWQIY